MIKRTWKLIRLATIISNKNTRKYARMKGKTPKNLIIRLQCLLLSSSDEKWIKEVLVKILHFLYEKCKRSQNWIISTTQSIISSDLMNKFWNLPGGNFAKLRQENRRKINPFQGWSTPIQIKWKNWTFFKNHKRYRKHRKRSNVWTNFSMK